MLGANVIVDLVVAGDVQSCSGMWQWGGLQSLVIFGFFSNLKKINLKAYDRKDALLSEGLPCIFPCAERQLNPSQDSFKQQWEAWPYLLCHTFVAPGNAALLDLSSYQQDEGVWCWISGCWYTGWVYGQCRCCADEPNQEICSRRSTALLSVQTWSVSLAVLCFLGYQLSCAHPLWAFTSQEDTGWN